LRAFFLLVISVIYFVYHLFNLTVRRVRGIDPAEGGKAPKVVNHFSTEKGESLYYFIAAIINDIHDYTPQAARINSSPARSKFAMIAARSIPAP
jgi:hypothetical protein